MIFQQTLTFTSNGRSTTNISQDVNAIVAESGIQIGTCHVFVQHTSASLMICENADPDVRRDLETYMQHIVPDGDAMFLHQDEGPDDMSAHQQWAMCAGHLAGYLFMGTPHTASSAADYSYGTG